MDVYTPDVDEITVKVKDGKGVRRPAIEKSNLLVDKNGNIIVNSMKPNVEISDEINEKAQTFIENFHGFLKERTDAYVKRLNAFNGQATPQAGDPVLASGYQYWNALTVGPVQFFGNPPYRPGKIIAAGELALMLGVVWINPANSDGGGLPGTAVLGDRDYRVRFETINLTNVSNGPDATFVGTFPSLAPIINLFPWFFIPGDPGVNPNLYETTLTADVTIPQQPLAAFSTWHLDLDQEPAFLGRPTRFPEWQYDIPAKYLVYKK